MSIPSVFSTLAPQPVWQHFATLCAIPRPSKHEAALVAHLRDWATRRGIAARVDSAGNLILQKPATPGQEGAPGVVLQGHLDMVCQQETGHGHDFLRDPITPELEDGWLIARHTTLGADNGIGVALALAALEDATLIHGPLEVLLTVDEEAGMSGAHRLAPGSLRGRYLLNLDTEAWGKFYLGCAGGVTVAATWPVTSEAAPAHWQGARLTLDGLPGGHSGIDIHRPHAHAIRDLQQVLRDAASEVDFALARLEGGTAINALPRFAEAHLALPLENFAALKQWVAQADARLKNTWGDVAPQLGLRLEAAPLPERVIADASWLALASVTQGMPYGVAAMSADFPGVVETSNNIAPFKLTPEGGAASFFVRSLKTAERDALAQVIARRIEAKLGGEAVIEGACPPWTPRPDSTLLARCEAVYQAEFGVAPEREVIHAGLECGLFAESHPHLDLLSFGPDIRNAHAPGERVNVASVERCWRLLRRILVDLASIKGE